MESTYVSVHCTGGRGEKTTEEMGKAREGGQY